jgi:hypothetical protein
MISAIVLAAFLSVLVSVALVRRFYRLCTFKAGAFWKFASPNESTRKNIVRNELSDEVLNEILSTYDFGLEVPQTEYITCKWDSR